MLQALKRLLEGRRFSKKQGTNINTLLKSVSSPPVTVANINTTEMDGKQNDTTGATQQCSSASLPLTGRFFLALISVYRRAAPSALTACPENVTSDLRLAPLCAEELCLDLSRAIEAGDVQAASQHAAALARQSVSLTIQLSEKNYPDGEIK